MERAPRDGVRRPRLQLGAILTRRSPGRLAPDATGTDVAQVLETYRADVLHAGKNSTSGDTAARFDASLEVLRQLGPLTAAAPEAPPTAPATPTPAAPAEPLTNTRAPGRSDHRWAGHTGACDPR
ncbi:MAG: hypothetical protein GEV07_24935 [Streptosporangiales bacterium]|nr:hypothetical protein [Streptosporangiales bacterium]